MPLDDESLYLDPEDDGPVRRGGRKTQRRRAGRREDGFFIVPVAWARVLTRARRAATRNAAWSLLERAGSAYDGQKIYWPEWEAAQVGVSRRARWGALHELEELGLIELHHVNGAPFAVVMRCLD
jgi:hypothetical protein